MDDSVQIAFLYIIPPTVAALASAIVSLRNGRKIADLRVEVDGRLTQLLARTAEASRLQGAADETERAIVSARRKPV